MPAPVPAPVQRATETANSASEAKLFSRQQVTVEGIDHHAAEVEPVPAQQRATEAAIAKPASASEAKELFSRQQVTVPAQVPVRDGLDYGSLESLFCTTAWRVLRNDEDPALGLICKNSSSKITPGGHVTSGSRNNGSRYISVTLDRTVAELHAREDGCRVVEMDLTLVTQKQIDVSYTVLGRTNGLRGNMALRFANKSREVLIEGSVNASAITAVYPAGTFC